MKFENTEVFNFEGALRGMRNPMNSWNRSDSYQGEYCYVIGENDLKLAQTLIKAGAEHRKFMRQIFVSVDITAPLYWWSEYDTYKVGTTANSCSKMHKMLAKPFEMNDFSFNELPGYKNEVGQYIPDFDYDKEVWKEIEQTGYEVGNFGRIRHGNRILAGSCHNDGYIFTTIKGNQTPIHVFVAKAFIPNPNNLPEVNHKDGNKMNNSAENLEWVTRSENQKHAVNLNLQPKNLSTYTGKFSDEQREEIKKLWNSGEYSKREIAKKYNVSHTCICDIINNKYRYATKVNIFKTVAKPIIDTLNELRDSYLYETNVTKKKQIWYTILQLLPSSYNQKRTVTMTYENVFNIIHQRKNHKLNEWSGIDNINEPNFISWAKELPYAKELLFIEKKGADN